MKIKLQPSLRLMGILCGFLLLSGCGTVRLEVPEGHQVRMLAHDESAEIHVQRTVWFWLWGGKAISDNTTRSDIEKYHLKEIRAYTKQTMTDNIVTLFTSIASLARRTLVVEGNTVSSLPTDSPVVNGEKP